MTSRKYKNFSAVSSASSPVIFIDLDETLIRTHDIKRRLSELLLRAGADPQAKRLVKAAFEPSFSLREYKALGRSRNISARGVYTGFNRLFRKPREFNFPGMTGFLRSLAKKYELQLLTYGDRDLQIKKIRQAGIRPYFRKIVITGDQTKEDVLRRMKNKNAVLLDDNPSVCAVAEKFGIKCVLVQKGPKDTRYYRKLARLI